MAFDMTKAAHCAAHTYLVMGFHIHSTNYSYFDLVTFQLSPISLDCINLKAISYSIGAISILPVPRYTLTKPSPETAEPIKLLLDFSTLKSRVSDHAMA